MLAGRFRFHGRGSLRHVYTEGAVVRSNFLQLKYKPNPRRTQSRLAVVVAKKVSKKSPVRNRIRRRIYEIARLQWPMLEESYDLVVTVFDERVADMEHANLNKLVVELFSKANLYKN